MELWGHPQPYRAVPLVVLRVGGGVLLADRIELHLLPGDAVLGNRVSSGEENPYGPPTRRPI